MFTVKCGNSPSVAFNKASGERMREKIDVIGVDTRSAKGQARMTLTAEISSTAQLLKALDVIRDVSGVPGARRS